MLTFLPAPPACLPWKGQMTFPKVRAAQRCSSVPGVELWFTLLLRGANCGHAFQGWKSLAPAFLHFPVPASLHVLPHQTPYKLDPLIVSCLELESKYSPWSAPSITTTSSKSPSSLLLCPSRMFFQTCSRWSRRHSHILLKRKKQRPEFQLHWYR